MPCEARVPFGRGANCTRVSLFAIRPIFLIANKGSVGIRLQHRTTEVVSVEVGQHAVLTHGDAVKTQQRIDHGVEKLAVNRALTVNLF